MSTIPIFPREVIDPIAGQTFDPADAADELRNEIDWLRKELAALDLSPAEFKAIVEAECPGRRWKVETWSYVYSSHYGAKADRSNFEATVYPIRDGHGVTLKAASLRELARLIVELHRHLERSEGRSVA